MSSHIPLQPYALLAINHSFYTSISTAKPFSVITQCCIHELYLQGRPSQPAVDLAKTFERRKCNHREVVPGDHCILSVVGEHLSFVSNELTCDSLLYCMPTGEKNQHRYVVASQSQTLRSQLRKVPAVPMVHINRSVMVMEPPSDVTLQAKVRVGELNVTHVLMINHRIVGKRGTRLKVRLGCSCNCLN